MDTPSPESLRYLMTCVKAACDVAHRDVEGLQELREDADQISAAPVHVCRFGWGTELPSAGRPGAFSLIFKES